MIYGDQAMLGRPLRSDERGEGKEIYTGGLDTRYQYLWVDLDLYLTQEGYPLDWTHEREWRCLTKAGDRGVPLILPGDDKHDVGKTPALRLLVDKRDEAELLRKVLNSPPPAEWWPPSLSQLLPRAKIIALDEAQSEGWKKIEDVPEERLI